MADNLVSKFTVNSQGTDIDVKIKDEDARNLIAQEISDRDSAVTTVTNNLNKEISDRESADTTITNNLNKEISDRSELISKDTEGNTNVISVTGDVNVSGKNITDTTTNMSLNVDGILDFNTKNPIKYSTPQILNNHFKYIPAMDRNGNKYKILVDNGAVFGSDFFSGIVIGCGDSIARGYPLSTNDGTLNKIAEKTGKTINTDFYNVAEDATGYTNLNGKITFRQQIEKLNNVITDKSNVTGIIVIGGTNDFGSGVATTDWANAVDDFITYAHSTYPNAKIAIVSNFMSCDGDVLRISECLHVLQTVKYPAYHVANLGVALKKWYLANGDTMSDIIHPNAKGYDLSASFIINKIMGGVTEDYTFVRLSTRGHWDSCYIFNGEQFIFQFFSSDHFGNSDITKITHNNPGIMCNFNFTLKMRTVGLGGEVDQAWVASQDCLGFVTFETSTAGWVNCFAPSLIKYELGNNGKIYAKIAGIDTKGSNGFIASNTIRELWCNPWLDGNLNHITLLVD